MKDFFIGLEHSSSFGFYISDEEKFLPVKEVKYELFDGNCFPFVLFSDELRSINDYCCTIVNAIDKEFNRVIYERDHPPDYVPDEWGWGCEIDIALEEKAYTWKWLSSVSVAHLVTLLMAFFEKTLKYVYDWYRRKGIIKKSIKYGNRSKIFFFTANFRLR